MDPQRAGMTMRTCGRGKDNGLRRGLISMPAKHRGCKWYFGGDADVQGGSGQGRGELKPRTDTNLHENRAFINAFKLFWVSNMNIIYMFK